MDAIGRQPFVTGLIPGQWVLIMESEEGHAEPPRAVEHRTVRDYYNGIRLVIEADIVGLVINTMSFLQAVNGIMPSATRIKVQQSDDGGTNWADVYDTQTLGIALQPGGNLDINVTHVMARFRVVALSMNSGLLRTTLLPPQDQQSPDYLKPAITTVTACSVGCETTEETV